MKPFELVIFDLGRVLLDFDFKKVTGELGRFTTKTQAEIRDYFATTPLWDAFERGSVSPQDFFAALKRDLQLKNLTFEQFKPFWNDIFQEKKDTIEILEKLKGRYRLAMISNVNQMHWEHVLEKHSFMTWFEVPIASYAVGHRKPELAIYELALKRAGVPGRRAIFIDDIFEHITAARQLGIHGHHFKTAPELLTELNQLLKESER
jgi:HAD superfamily hydrolase (TIGR01549 family)